MLCNCECVYESVGISPFWLHMLLSVQTEKYGNIWLKMRFPWFLNFDLCLGKSYRPCEVQYSDFIDHLNLYRFSALKWRKLIGAGEVSRHLYFTVQPAYFRRGTVSKPGYQTSSNRFLLRFPLLAYSFTSF